MEWSLWTESSVFERRGIGKMRNVVRKYATLSCPLCGEKEVAVVLKERLVSLRPRAVRDHLLTCPAVAEEQRGGFERATLQQQRIGRPESNKKSKGDRHAEKAAKAAAKASAKAVMQTLQGEEPGAA